ncbi:RloB family protein [Bacteroides sp. 519]|uniref:RloB family protein n=1 Tax=Bacteroides sp. 519 TaxID=2302937 RepID=UPI0013D11FDA|nr:RloB family protein [Bacteroides sp. 519]
MRAPKKTKNNIIIICEGTDTEFNYFESAKRRTDPSLYSEIKVLPIAAEIQAFEKNSKRKTKKLENPPSYKYYYKEETNEADYNKYKAQPLRYVREVQLFMEEDGFIEGWAVFDKDGHHSPQEAFSHAKNSSVFIAFSSYSFEQWFLTHFERSEMAFSKSDCKEKKKSIECGTGKHVDDCRGEICIAGALREKGYIKDYSKSNKTIFDCLYPRLHKAFINAAWIRKLDTQPIYLRNPYTNVDFLVKRLLNITMEYEWYTSSEDIPFSGTTIRFELQAGNLIIKNTGNRSFILRPDNIWSSTDPYTNGNSLFQRTKEIVPGNTESVPNFKHTFIRVLDNNQTIIIYTSP